MKWLDRWLQTQRFKAIAPFLDKHASVLDIGSDDGAMFKFFGTISGIGLDDGIEKDINGQTWQILRKSFPDGFDTDQKFDAITMLAVMEHLPDSTLQFLSDKCHYFLKPDGVILITVPDIRVDHILHFLKFLGLVNAETLHQHHGFDPRTVADIFDKKQFMLLKKRKFELGLNNLYAFKKIL